MAVASRKKTLLQRCSHSVSHRRKRARAKVFRMAGSHASLLRPLFIQAHGLSSISGEALRLGMHTRERGDIHMEKQSERQERFFAR